MTAGPGPGARGRTLAEAVVGVVHDGLPLGDLWARLLGRPRKAERV